MSLNINLILLILILFFGFFVSPFISAFASGPNEGEKEGIIRVFARTVKKRKEALVMWCAFSFLDAVLGVLFLYYFTSLPMPLAFLFIALLLALYVFELHGINVMFGGWKAWR